MFNSSDDPADAALPDWLCGQRLRPRHLRRWPLPEPDPDGDKESRGHVLLVAGSRELPGAALLAANAALRAGAGKLTLVTAQSVALSLALAVPEARVVALPETAAGGLDLQQDSHAQAQLLGCLESADAVLIGPGLMDRAASCALVQVLLEYTPNHAKEDAAKDAPPIILDALAMDALMPSEAAVSTARRPLLLTPHAGEMAHLTGKPKDAVQADPLRSAQAAAKGFGASIALKGPCTWLVNPAGQWVCHEGGSANLAASGSGDVLAGLMVGLCARGGSLLQAAAWAVWLHARAGRRLTRRMGTLGSLARELPAEIPRLMQRYKLGP